MTLKKPIERRWQLLQNYVGMSSPMILLRNRVYENRIQKEWHANMTSYEDCCFLGTCLFKDHDSYPVAFYIALGPFLNRIITIFLECCACSTIPIIDPTSRPW